MRAHATQIPANSWLYSIASNFGGEFMGVEYYTLAVGERGPGFGRYGWEDDLFAGLDLSEGVPAAPAAQAGVGRPPVPGAASDDRGAGTSASGASTSGAPAEAGAR